MLKLVSGIPKMLLGTRFPPFWGADFPTQLTHSSCLSARCSETMLGLGHGGGEDGYLPVDWPGTTRNATADRAR